MRRHFFLIVALSFCLLVLAASGIFLWQNNLKRNRQQPTSPVVKKDLTQVLSTELEPAGLVLESAPAILGETISASISGYFVLFSKDDDLPTQVRALQLVLPRLKMDNRKVSVIDLRFSKVIIR